MPMLLSLALLFQSQAPPIQPIKLTTPDATLPEEFSAVRGIRELADGRVLVSDYMDERVVLVDFFRKTVTPKVTQGSGPREARLPTRLIPIPGDSTLLADLGNNRLLLLDPVGSPVRTITAERPGQLGVRGVDIGGGYYYAVPAWSEANPLANDSVHVVRWTPKNDAETPVTVIQGDRMRSDIRSPARTPRIPTVGYAAQDGWTLDDQGRIRVVRAGGYRVESFRLGQAAVSGPSYAFPTRPVSPADRVAFVREFLTQSPTSGKGPGGGLGHSALPTEAEIAATTPGTQFAERHPMFSAGDVITAPGGMLWVGRPSEAGKPVGYDVFDGSGRRIAQVEMGTGRRILAVGRKGLYVVREQESGLQYLERYPVPPVGSP